MNATKRCKIVLVGDVTVGKSSLLITRETGNFPLEYVPAVVDTYTNVVIVDGNRIELELWDLHYNPDWDRHHILAYPGTDIFLICFAINSPISFERVTTKWYNEVIHYCPDSKVILVGMKIDLREDKETIKRLNEMGYNMITKEQGKELAKEILAIEYLECSSLTGKGVHTIFDVALRIGIDDGPKDRKCWIM